MRMIALRDPIQGFRVREGLSCVLFCAVLPGKTRNLALVRLENPVSPNQPEFLPFLVFDRKK